MNLRSTFLLAAALLAGPAGAAAANSAKPSQPGKILVVLFGGQSNAAGWGYHQYLLDQASPLASPQRDVEMFAGAVLPQFDHALTELQCGAGNPKLADAKKVQQYPALAGTDEQINHFGPELSLGRTVRDLIEIPGSKVVVIKHAVGGSTLFKQWKPDGTADSSKDGIVYQAFQKTVHAGLAALKAKYPDREIQIIGMGWVQGESDTLQGQQANYQKNLTTFIADIRATFGKDIVFALSKLSPNQSDKPPYAVVRAAQAAVAAAVPKVIATETSGPDYPVADGFAEGPVHYRSAALLQIGKDLGEAIVKASAVAAKSAKTP